jgi:drug/metabolite transporter superfamily protein YnfA
MSEIFNGIMRAISSLLGLVMVAFGGIWILQGFDLAFRVGFMVGHKQWALYGLILALVGLCQIVWSNTRETYYRKK